MTPRLKDTAGMSTYLTKPNSGSFQTIDVAKANEAGFNVIQDGKNHASITPKNDPNGAKLEEWAKTKDAVKDDESKAHELSKKLKSCTCRI